MGHPLMPTLVRSLLDHPSPPVVALQRRTMAALLAVMFAGVALARALNPKETLRMSARTSDAHPSPSPARR